MDKKWLSLILAGMILWPGPVGAETAAGTMSAVEAIAVLTDKNRAMMGDINIVLTADNDSPCHLKTYWLFKSLRYSYFFDEQDAPSWQALMQDSRQSIYARLLAAYYLLPRDEAQQFVLGLMGSDNLRHRYNAANIFYLYASANPREEWAADLLIDYVASHALDDNGIRSSPDGDFPEGDRDDVLNSPLDDICILFGRLRLRRAVPVLIALLEREPLNRSAVYALGEIGDLSAGRVLLKMLEQDNARSREDLVEALGELKYAEAVPALIIILNKTLNNYEAAVTMDRALLEALLKIGDRRALQPIRDFIRGPHASESRAVARRVLAQMESPDPVEDLIGLLQGSNDRYESSNIIRTLIQYHDQRVVKVFSRLARSSPSADLRRDALDGLFAMADRDSLLELAALLEADFPDSLEDDLAKVSHNAFSRYFPEYIAGCLREVTRQDFGQDAAKWRAWIEANVQNK